jgi:hypothetical protein
VNASPVTLWTLETQEATEQETLEVRQWEEEGERRARWQCLEWTQ